MYIMENIIKNINNNILEAFLNCLHALNRYVLESYYWHKFQNCEIC